MASLFLPPMKSLTYDEDYYYESGVAVLSGKPSESKLPVPNIMPASALNPLFSKAIRDAIPDPTIPESISIEEYRRFKSIYLGKLPTIFVSLVLAIYVFWWARQLYGINAGFLALSLYVLDPNIIAHSRVVTQDIFGACSLFIATYYFWNFLKFGDRKNAVLSMITFGIAQISRYTAVYLLPIYLILTIGFYSSTILNLIRTKKFKIILSGIKQFCTYTILLLFTTILIINIGFSFEKTFTKLGDYQFESRAFTSLQASSPLLRALPVPVPYVYLRGLDLGKYKQETGIGSGPAYLMGRLGLENNGELRGFKEYFIIAFLYKVPIATQLLLLMAVVSLLRYRHRINFWQNEAFLIIPSLFFFIVFSGKTAQIGIRYILMIFPFLFVFSSRLAVAWTALRNRYRIFVTSLVAYLLISNLSYFPHYLSYFNELLLDRKMAYTILADSNLDWGQNWSYLFQYLERNPDAKYMICRRNKLKQEVNPQKFQVDLVVGGANQEEVNPQKFQADLVVVGANQLLGITTNPKNFQWLRENKKPVDHVAYSHLVFKIEPQDLEDIGDKLNKESFCYDRNWRGASQLSDK
ncbi:MAG: glycosyltransferase family 39 protein [Cyanobacteria bacterium P01_H01_bin.35]